MKRKTLVTFSALIVLALFLAVGTAGATHCKGSRCKWGDQEHALYKKVGMMMANQEEVGITDEQMEKIRTIKMNTKRALIQQKANIDLIKVNIKEKMWQDTIDVEAVNALIDQKYDLKKTKAKTLVNACSEIRSILTAEQRKQFKQLYIKKKMSHKR